MFEYFIQQIKFAKLGTNNLVTQLRKKQSLVQEKVSLMIKEGNELEVYW